MTSPLKIFLVILFCLIGCVVSQYQKLYPLPESDVRVIGDKIYHKDKLFAELRYLWKGEKEWAQGLSIFYHLHNKEVWIYPVEGWKIRKGDKEYSTISDIERVMREERVYGHEILLGNKIRGKSEILSTWVFDVKISEDGKYVYYKTSGIFFDSSNKYLVEYGVSK